MAQILRVLPAYPLFVKDPYFSIWSAGDVLNETDTSFWTGKSKKTYGIIQANGKSYCFLGVAKNVENLTQTSIVVTTFRTKYSFTCEEFDLEIAFFSPVPINDYKIWSCPVCYMEYKIIPKTRLTGVSVSLSLHEEWCYYGTENKEVRGDVFVADDMEIAYFGLNRQHIFNRTGDRLGADWGYYYVGADKCFYHTIDDFSNLTIKENWVEAEQTDSKYLTAQNVYPMITDSVCGKVLIAFDDVVSINYYGEMLRGYYFSEGGNIMDAILFSVKEYDKVCEVCENIENQIFEDTQKYSDKYRSILNASYRQTLASHKLVKDSKDRLLLLSKECGSGGCVATVDVTYPTMPMLLLYQPELVKASIEPIFDFAKMQAWEYEFAPHDAGMYPFCNGQFYGVKNKTDGKYGRGAGYQGDDWSREVLPPYYLYRKGADLYDYNRQMPIEECADMILICSFYLACGGDREYITGELDLLRQWCEYLIAKGLIPEKQLCTDDFLNHMDKNVNLAIKATVAIGAFAKLLQTLGCDGTQYETIAKERVAEFAKRFEHSYMPLSFDDKEDTFSMKYNLMPDTLLGLDLFDKATVRKEIDVCLAHLLKYGIPLDNRSNLTKTDWMMWMAALSDNVDEQEQIIDGIYNYLVECIDRVPFADLYDCDTSTAEKFTNRTVQGSMFILLLKNKMKMSKK